MSKSEPRAVRAVPTPAVTLLAICRKCGKKAGGGFGDGGGESLAKALRHGLGLPKPKRSPVRIVETGCMKLCPKHAVVVASSRDPSILFVVRAGTPVAEVAASLGIVAAADRS